MDPIVVVRLDRAALVWINCPVDGTVTPRLHRALRELLEDGASPIVVDLAAASSVDPGGTAVLAEAAARAGDRGSGLELRLPGGVAWTVRDARQLRFAVTTAYPTPA
jgi:anti-anti-sigma regulatory factor